MTRLAVLEGNRSQACGLSGSRGDVDPALISEGQLKTLDPNIIDSMATGTWKDHPSKPDEGFYIDSTGFDVGQINKKQLFLREAAIAAGLAQGVINKAGERVVDDDTWIAAKIERERALTPLRKAAAGYGSDLGKFLPWVIGAFVAFKFLG
jgi:hypothetical protein